MFALKVNGNLLMSVGVFDIKGQDSKEVFIQSFASMVFDASVAQQNYLKMWMMVFNGYGLIPEVVTARAEEVNGTTSFPSLRDLWENLTDNYICHLL